MQKHKLLFQDPQSNHTLCDTQHCLRLTDLEEVGDLTHHLDFYMLGLFSFKQLSVQNGVDFWMSFLKSVDCSPDTVTIHPDKSDWVSLYDQYDVDIQLDPECLWSDGNIGGYCTEFYLKGVEIGNIVNPLEHSLDCGFGLERIEKFWNNQCGIVSKSLTRSDVLNHTIEVLLEQGVIPSHQKQGYVLRRLIREQLQRENLLSLHPLIEKEKVRRNQIIGRMDKLVKKHPHQPKEWFWETHGIHMDDWQK